VFHFAEPPRPELCQTATADSTTGGAIHLVLESTGLEVFGQGEWNASKHGRARRKSRKLHAAVDAGTGEITAHILTDGHADDAAQVSALLRQTHGQIASVTADGAYDNDAVYQEAAAARQRHPPAAVAIPPRASAVLSTDVAAAQSPHGRHIASRGRMAWQKEAGYGRRNQVETAIGRYQHLIGPELRARSQPGQQGEVAIGVAALNTMIRTAKPMAVRAG
jgi:hypothetical protein